MKCAKNAYDDFHTTVNDVNESGLIYGNTMSEYARMDNILASSRLSIGWSSNLAMLSLTYYWTELAKDPELIDHEKLKELYDNFVILAIIAQIAIDSSKRVYSVSPNDEVVRIQNLPCMQYIRYETTSNGKKKKYKYDLPMFMKFVREPSPTKNGNYLPYEVIKKDKDKLKKRINPEFICPMNWLVECLDKTQIEHAGTPVSTSIREFFIKEYGWADNRQMSKIRLLIDNYNNYIKSLSKIPNDEIVKNITQKTEELISSINGMKMGKATVNRLIETALGLEDITKVNKNSQRVNKRYCRKLLTIIYRTNKEYFLNCFNKSNIQ